MMKINTCLYAAAFLAGSTVTVGCVDDNYDLSDIDTTAEIKVKDLVVPVNIDEITLSDIFDLDDNSTIKKTSDGYAMIESGTFNSSAVDIPEVIVGAPSFAPNSSVLYPETMVPGGKSVKLPSSELYFPIKGGHASDFFYENNFVSEYIVSMKSVGTKWTYSVELTVSNVADKLRKFEFRDIVLELPAGLEGSFSYGTYNKETGLCEIPSLVVENGKAEYVVEVTSIDIAKAKINYDYSKSTIKFEGHVGVVSGYIVVNTADFIGITTLDELEFRTQNTLSDLVITDFSGEVKYNLSGFDIPSIKLDDLPDVLAQEETNIRLANPQIYIRLNNPVGKYSVYAETGLTLTASRADEAPKAYSLDKGAFRIGADRGNGPYTYCLALPGKPDRYYEGFENAEHVDFSGLADVLSGEGIPSAIGVTLDNPRVPVQTVEGFRLGKLDAVEGEYLFYVPFALGDGSTIVYSDIVDGWNDEDLDAVTVSNLSVTATVTNDLPFDVTMTGYPVDVNGKIINSVQIEGAVIKGNTANNPIDIHITGEVKHLDGISFRAVANGIDTGKALGPNQNIKLRDIKARVSGSYVKEL